MPSDYTTRLSVEIPEDLYLKMKDKIPWGLTRKVIIVLLEDFLNLVDEHGNLVIAAVLNRSINVSDIVKDIGKEIPNAAERP